MSNNNQTYEQEKRSRLNALGRSFQVMLWVSQRRLPFTVRQLQAELGTTVRSAHRWMNALEGNGLVESVEGQRWKAQLTITRRNSTYE